MSFLDFKNIYEINYFWDSAMFSVTWSIFTFLSFAKIMLLALALIKKVLCDGNEDECPRLATTVLSYLTVMNLSRLFLMD